MMSVTGIKTGGAFLLLSRYFMSIRIRAKRPYILEFLCDLRKMTFTFEEFYSHL